MNNALKVINNKRNSFKCHLRPGIGVDIFGDSRCWYYHVWCRILMHRRRQFSTESNGKDWTFHFPVKLLRVVMVIVLGLPIPPWDLWNEFFSNLLSGIQLAHVFLDFLFDWSYLSLFRVSNGQIQEELPYGERRLFSIRAWPQNCFGQSKY